MQGDVSDEAVKGVRGEGRGVPIGEKGSEAWVVERSLEGAWFEALGGDGDGRKKCGAEEEVMARSIGTGGAWRRVFCGECREKGVFFELSVKEVVREGLKIVVGATGGSEDGVGVVKILLIPVAVAGGKFKVVPAVRLNERNVVSFDGGRRG